MTDRCDSLRYYGGARGEERLLREDLRGFHICVSAEDAVDPARTERWQGLSSLRLREATDVDLTAEAAWALLATWAGRSASDEAAMDDEDLRALTRGLIATMPPLIKWLRYVEQFPSGEGMEEFRRHRREAILRWLPHVHPDPSTLAEHVRGDPALPALARAGISAHLWGPYGCFSCRRAAQRLSPAPSRAETSQRLVAATAADEPRGHEAIVSVRGAEYHLCVSFLADGDFLRVFASYAGDRTLPRTAMKLAVVFGGGQVREGSIVYPDHGLIGANLGPLRGLRLEDIVSFSLEP
jgi:hypothetical protein